MKITQTTKRIVNNLIQRSFTSVLIKLIIATGVISSYAIGQTKDTIYLLSTRTYFKMGTTSVSETIATGADSGIHKLCGQSFIIIDTDNRTLTSNGSDVYYEEIVDISELSINYGVIRFHDDVNDFNYVIDFNRNIVRRISPQEDNITNIVEYQF
jgi:hypothetical protein